MPLPFRRNLRPLCIPAGIFSVTGPSRVCTRAFVPRAASQGARGRSVYTSRPSRRKRG
jgi:hypothetical protein